MSDETEAVVDVLTAVQFALEGVAEGINRYVCDTCEGTGNLPSGPSCPDCEGDGDHLLSAVREIRNNQLAMTKALNRIASAVEHLAEVRHG